MIREFLLDYLKEHKTLQKGMLVKSLLIDKLEIVGFLNDAEPRHCITNMNALSISTEASINLHNAIAIYNGYMMIGSKAYEYYSSLEMNENKQEINIESLYIPSLVSSDLYKYIRTQKNTRPITDKLLRDKNYPASIIAKDNTAIRVVEEGEILMKDRLGRIKSIAEDIDVICRHVNSATGVLSYTVLGINDLLVEELV